MTTATVPHTRPERVLDGLRRSGNPFRNYFARNPDDEVCARYHVPELYAQERQLLLSVVDLYRYDPTTHSEVVPILGNKGAGKTHLLHSIKHGTDGAWQMLVTPGVYQKDADFLEYLLFQIIDTLLGGGKQRGVRPLDYLGENVVRRLLGNALLSLNNEEKLDLFPVGGLARFGRKLGLGVTQAQERTQWLVEQVVGHGTLGKGLMPLHQALTNSGLPVDQALNLIEKYVDKTEAHNAAGLMRREVYKGFSRAYLLKDEAKLADFLTHDFVEMPFQVRPSRQDLVLGLFKVLMEVFRALKIPVVVAFDQLEDLLLARRSDDAHKTAETFFAGIVQVMHQIDGLCFLIFAERGLWNRFVPSLDGYIQDRLNNPVHVPGQGTIKALRLEVPSVELVRRVIEARLSSLSPDVREFNLDPLYPFTEEQVRRIAQTEPTLRDMLQQCRHLFDHLVYGQESIEPIPPAMALSRQTESERPTEYQSELNHRVGLTSPSELPSDLDHRKELASPSGLPSDLDHRAGSESQGELQTEPVNRMVEAASLGSMEVMASPDVPPVGTELPRVPSSGPASSGGLSTQQMMEIWAQEHRSALRKLQPDGALTGATRELQAALGTFLQICHEHGVKVGPWRLQHTVAEYTFGEHPTYGVMSIAHWACKDAPPWKVGLGLFLAKGAGKPKDLEIKLSSMGSEPSVIDHLILLRPEDDLTLTGKSKTIWAEAEKKGHHARLEPMSLEELALLYSFPRWLASVKEALPEGQPLPNLADLIQDTCEKLLEQVCMPIQN